ncbi:MAG: hypothetical protein H7345_19035, partial [Rubritepida sp.]|nr:hypothetical protein [Rubritepida sp.]
LMPGGHVEALHLHRKFRFHAKIDIERFFYLIGRSKVARCLKDLGIERHVQHAKWSCVKNPYGLPTYSLPYGFVQSPILSTLVLATSNAGTVIERLSKSCQISVYVDDILLSSNDEAGLKEIYGDIKNELLLSQFQTNLSKCSDPGTYIEIFNCELKSGYSAVTAARIDKFQAVIRSQPSVSGFNLYCAAIQSGSAVDK